MAKHFADRRRGRRQRPERRVTIEIAAARHRALAADVQRCQRIDLARIRLADDHAELLMHARIGSRRFHPAEFQRRAPIGVEVGQDCRGSHGLGREAYFRSSAHRARGLCNRRAIRRHQERRHAVECTHPIDVMPNHFDARGLTRADRLVQFVDRRLFETERLLLYGWPLGFERCLCAGGFTQDDAPILRNGSRYDCAPRLTTQRARRAYEAQVGHGANDSLSPLGRGSG